MPISREIRLKAIPKAFPTVDDFELAEVRVPDPAPGEVQVRNQWMSVDPWMMRAVREAIYPPPEDTPIAKFGSAIAGRALYGGAIGVVTASRADGVREGDLVQTLEGWREAFTISAKEAELLPDMGLPPETYLHVAGLTGLTAYSGMANIAKVGAGDVVFVTAAAGAVGSIACQIANIRGAEVIGSAGGPEKAAFLKEIGVDHAIDYRAVPDLEAALRRAAPEGTTVHFENVGGSHLEAGLNVARPKARIVLCGLITTFSSGAPQSLPGNLMRVIRQRYHIEGLSVGDHMHEMPKFRAQVSQWIKDGRLKWRETVDTGIEAAPSALLKLFTGGNIGKMLVKLS